MNCRNCNFNTDEDVKFCPVCGTPFSQESEDGSSTPEMSSVEERAPSETLVSKTEAPKEQEEISGGPGGAPPGGTGASYPPGNMPPPVGGMGTPYPLGNMPPPVGGMGTPYPLGNMPPTAGGMGTPYPPGNIPPPVGGMGTPYPTGNIPYYQTQQFGTGTAPVTGYDGGQRQVPGYITNFLSGNITFLVLNSIAFFCLCFVDNPAIVSLQMLLGIGGLTVSILGVVFSSRAKTMTRMGDTYRAQTTARTARILFFVSLAIFCFKVVLFFSFMTNFGDMMDEFGSYFESEGYSGGYYY